jgi:hypothetical protein
VIAGVCMPHMEVIDYTGGPSVCRRRRDGFVQVEFVPGNRNGFVSVASVRSSRPASCRYDHIVIGVETRHPEAGRRFEQLVGVDHQCVIAVLVRQVRHLGAFLRKIDSRPLMQFARNVAQSIANNVRGAVGRAGVDDDPMIDQRPNRREAARHGRRFVPDEHPKQIFCRRDFAMGRAPVSGFGSADTAGAGLSAIGADPLPRCGGSPPCSAGSMDNLSLERRISDCDFPGAKPWGARTMR